VGSLACSHDNANCAESTEKDGVYRGALVNHDGSPAANTEFTVAFQSREGEADVAFTTDANGAFCIRWANESITPHVQEDQLTISEAEFPEDRSLSNFKESTSGPPDCQSSDATIPWNRAETLQSSWQFVLMMGLAAGAALVLLLALLRPREQSAASVLRIGVVLLGAAILATVLGWLV
jgi:hypothetical protein